MVYFKIHLEENFVQTVSYKQIETCLREFVQKVVLKMVAQDVLKELESIEIENDKEW